METHKKQINKLCKSLHEKRFYRTYGKVLSISSKNVIMCLDLLLPLFWVMALLLPKKFNKEFARITLKNG